MDHGLDIERRVQTDLLRLAKDLGLPLVATNDLHYTTGRGRHGPRGAAVRAVRLDAGRPQPVQVRRRRLLPQVARGDAPRLARAARGVRQHAADRRAVRGVLHRGRGPLHAALPRAPRARTRQSWFVKEVERGLHEPLPRRRPATTPRKQAEYEIEVIVSKGYPGYFLVVADFINWAKDQRHPGRPGPWLRRRARWRAYAMGITDLDPLQHGLIFERFLNPERMSMPDFDIDFDERRRGEVIRYVTEKYGEERVAQIVTYGTIKAKQAIKDAARVLGYPFAMGDQLTKAMPPADHGQGHPARRASSTRATSATARPGSSARSTTSRPQAPARSSRPRAGSRA